VRACVRACKRVCLLARGRLWGSTCTLESPGGTGGVHAGCVRHIVNGKLKGAPRRGHSCCPAMSHTSIALAFGWLWPMWVCWEWAGERMPTRRRQGKPSRHKPLNTCSQQVAPQAQKAGSSPRPPAAWVAAGAAARPCLLPAPCLHACSHCACIVVHACTHKRQQVHVAPRTHAAMQARITISARARGRPHPHTAATPYAHAQQCPAIHRHAASQTHAAACALAIPCSAPLLHSTQAPICAP